jgi:hypothetical protein
VPAYAQALDSTHGKGALERLAVSAQPHLTGFSESARRLYRNFMQQVRR